MTTEPTPAPDAHPHQAPAQNPFAGIATSDLVRDGAALLLLLISLAMPWNLDPDRGIRDANDHVIVVLVTLLSVLSLVVTYLGRAQVFGAGISMAQVGLLRAAANLPYVVVVVIFLIIDMSRGDDDWYSSGGVGYAAALGLAGAAIAGMPRLAESGSATADSPLATRMRLATVGLSGLWVFISFINLVTVVVHWADMDVEGVLILAIIVSVLIVLVPLALLAYGLVRRSEVARSLAFTAGVIMLGAVIIDWFSDWEISGGGIDSVHRPVFGAIAFVTLGALASSHLTKSAMRPIDDVQRSVRSASLLLLAQAGLVAATAFITILTMISGDVVSTGKAVAYLFTLVIIGGLAAVAYSTLRTGQATTRTLGLILTAGMIIPGIVAISVVESMSSAGIVDLVYAFGLPLATLVLLTAPAAMRTKYGSLLPAGALSAAAPSAPPSPPAPPAPPAPHPRAAEAADPATSSAALFDIASNVPELRPAVAANPSTYPDLLTWLGELGDPAVDAALRTRE